MAYTDAQGRDGLPFR